VVTGYLKLLFAKGIATAKQFYYSWLELIRFAITGGVSTLLDLGGILLAQTIGCGVSVSVSFGYLLGLTINFFIHKYFTFNSRETVRFREVSLFLFVVLINYLLTLTIVNIMVLMGGGIIVGKLLSLPFVMMVGYVLGRKLVFRA